MSASGRVMLLPLIEFVCMMTSSRESGLVIVM